jgi:hypothetical protein
MKEETPREAQKPVISRKRKLVVLIFVIGFWIFFYWYNSFQNPPEKDTPPASIPSVPLEETRPANP